MTAGQIIIVSYGFPPYLKSLGGAIRILKLADYLIAQGRDVTVICAQTPHFDTFGYEQTLSRIKTIACKDRLATLSRRAESSTAGAVVAGAPPRSGSWARLQRRLKDVVLAAMVPDIGLPVTQSMFAAAKREIDSSKAPVTVITSGPPHSVHLVGKRLKHRYPNLTWIMDYRDSWNGTSLFRKRNRLLQRLNLSMERNCLVQADHLSYISSPMLPKAEAIARQPLTEKATLIANGYDENLLDARVATPSTDTKPMSLRIGYYGAIDHGAASYRDPAVIFRALQTLPEEAVQFIVHGPSTLEAGWEERLGRRLKNGGKLPHDAAVRSMFEMDVLLLLHTREEGADEVVTGKVFEYISTGLPIISVGPSGMAVNELLKDDPCFYSVDHRDDAGLAALFESLAQRAAVPGAPRRPAEAIRAFTRSAQYAKFLRLLTTPR